jgi:hypothetical protein
MVDLSIADCQIQIQSQNQNLWIFTVMHSQLAVRDSQESQLKIKARGFWGRKMEHNFLSPTLLSLMTLTQMIRKF